MRVCVESRDAVHERAFLDVLAETCRRLGHEVERWEVERPEPIPWRPDLGIAWNRACVADRPNLVAELGWLPRWSYQLSHTGINARHHLAAPRLEPLTAEQETEVKRHLERIRWGKGRPGFWAPGSYSDPTMPPAENMPTEGFILAPLQMPQDTNMENAPEHLRTEQGFIEAVSDMDPPWPIWFKAHPHSEAGYQVDLPVPSRMSPEPPNRWNDRIAPHAEANVHQYLKHPACRAVVTVNSNTAHDALLWGVPVVALGRGMWPDWMFGASLGWAVLPQDPVYSRRERNNAAYVHHLMRAQWRLDDASDPERVAEAIAGAVG